MLSGLHSLIPGAQFWPRFVSNRSEQFEARTVMTRIENSTSPWLSEMAGSVMPVAVAHGEGRAEFRRGDDLSNLQQAGQVAISYVDPTDKTTMVYPHNPNGAPAGLAGITANNGKVLITMPHPERVFLTRQNVWQDKSWGDYGPWMRLFRNARVTLG